MHRAFLTALIAASTISAFILPAQASVYGHANWGQFENDFEEPTKVWKEIEAQLPPAPKAGNLLEVRLDSSTRNTLYIDSDSLSVGDDDVVRYTAIIRSPSGAENISFEGLRCVTGERKLYAFLRTRGKETGTWSRNRNARWEPIQARLAGGYHRELFFHYLCTVNTRRDVPTLLRLLKTGGLYGDL